MSEVFKGKKCDSCGFLMSNPSFCCMNCGKETLSDIEYSGEASIYTYTVVHVAAGHLVDKTPYVLAVVELKEGLKVLTIVEGLDLKHIEIGRKVQFSHIDEKSGPIFRAA
ncbi:MAG: OB-fold domain-containing protein [Leptospiraceae bacterium]|nr:OB-fold domain-containing protein [Leptospiraceae bacterium]MCP5499009.1 OB-fold domain-containing protein [Leptospiraceae bacterium]